MQHLRLVFTYGPCSLYYHDYHVLRDLSCLGGLTNSLSGEVEWAVKQLEDYVDENPSSASLREAYTRSMTGSYNNCESLLCCISVKNASLNRLRRAKMDKNFLPLMRRYQEHAISS